MARVQQHGATPQRMPLADRPLKSRDRRAAHGNGTAFSAVAPWSGPHWPPVDPITREWYCPQARIAGRLTFQPVARFHPSGDSHQHRLGVWRICHIPGRKFRSSIENLYMHDGTSRLCTLAIAGSGRVWNSPACDRPIRAEACNSRFITARERGKKTRCACGDIEGFDFIGPR